MTFKEWLHGGPLHEWRDYSPPLFFSPVIDGERVRSNVMRRKINGVWEYRRMTPEELAEHHGDVAW